MSKPLHILKYERDNEPGIIGGLVVPLIQIAGIVGGIWFLVEKTLT